MECGYGDDREVFEFGARLRRSLGAYELGCMVCGSRETVVEFEHREDPTVKFRLCRRHALRAAEYGLGIVPSEEERAANVRRFIENMDREA